MGELTAADFDAYFLAVHGYEPYPWQSRLTRQVLEGAGWPDVIDLPTGVGKTAVLDTAIFALAVRPDISPRRIVFVIDRRIVVDQVYERAKLIRDKVSMATGGVLADVRGALSTLTDAEQPLGVAALRGGIPVDGEWAGRPDQPWVMVSTVDQFGSRLLFRGYGVSYRMRPVHAGLAGNDCLVILDEVHLSRAFAVTLRDVSSDGQVPLIRSVNSELLPRRFKVVEMSATPTNTSGRRFDLQDGDLEHSRLRQIAKAPKRAKLVEIAGNRPPHESVPGKVLELIKRELRDNEKSVGVIVNRVRTARAVHRALSDNGVSAHLVTGRMRPIDRKQVLDEIDRCVDPARTGPLDELAVVVATQAIEVGADFSFDALISEVAPTDSLCQRFGRLDRRGKSAAQRGTPARCWILGVASALNPKRHDPVYGDAARHAWEELRDSAEDGEIAVGPDVGLLARLSEDSLAPKQEAPLLLPTHVDAWSQTNPEPVADPPIEEFLHGKDCRHESDVSVVWRLDLSGEALELVPPRSAEFLSVPVSAFKGWLQGRVEASVADVDLVSPSDEREARGQNQPLSHSRLNRAIRWRGRGEVRPIRLERVDDVEPGDVIVVPCDWGGLRGGNWDASKPPGRRQRDSEDEADAPSVTELDLGDQAQLAYGVRATLRLDARLLEPLSIVVPPTPKEEADATQDREARARAWLDDLDPDLLPDWVSEAVARFRPRGSFRCELVEPDDAESYYVLVERAVDPAALDGFDEAPSMTGTEVRLGDHLSGVGRKVAAYGRALHLSETVVEDLRLAGELHDLGKMDSRFQAQLHGHDPVRIAESTASGEWLAKSLAGARVRPGEWPPVRHEFSSVALARPQPAVLERAHDPELVLHLVGTHHGFGRPIPQIKEDKESQQLEAVGHFGDDGFRLGAATAEGSDLSEEACGLVQMSVPSDLAATPIALEMADRFWRLQECYGHHGLAWLEAIFRLADHQRSAEEERNSLEVER